MRKYYFSLATNQLILALTLALSFSWATVAQVGIGTTTPQAMLDVVASDPANPTAMDGFLMPRVSSLTQDFQATAVGTMVFYNGPTGTGHGNMKNTVYFYDGNNWKNMSGEIASTTDPKVLYEYDAVNKGVVYWIDPEDPYHYKIVSPFQLGDIKYGDNSGAADCESHSCVAGELGGAHRTKAWNTAHSGLNSSNYSDYANSASYFFNGTDGVGMTPMGWHTPTSEELLFMVSNRSSINNSFATQGVAYTAIGNTEGYWACEDFWSDNSKALYVIGTGTYVVNKSPSNSYNIGLRIVKEIGG